MKIEWVEGDEEGNLYIKLISKDEDERQLIIRALESLNLTEPAPATLYVETGVIYGVTDDPEGRVMTRTIDGVHTEPTFILNAWKR